MVTVMQNVDAIFDEMLSNCDDDDRDEKCHWISSPNTRQQQREVPDETRKTNVILDEKHAAKDEGQDTVRNGTITDFDKTGEQSLILLNDIDVPLVRSAPDMLRCKNVEKTVNCSFHGGDPSTDESVYPMSENVKLLNKFMTNNKTMLGLCNDLQAIVEKWKESKWTIVAACTECTSGTTKGILHRIYGLVVIQVNFE